LGKLNPFQLLVMALIESSLFVLNGYIGYTVLGVVDVGGAMFIHTFGAYFGLACSLMSRNREVGKSEEKEESRYTSDIFSMVGTVLLWVYWPSFNAVLATGDGFHRAIVNTYISLIASTMATFIVSSLLGHGKRFEMVDVQNASLSGGVAVGAIADLMLQPYGAFLAGTICGVVSTLGYRILQGKLFDKLKLHDTCGIHNLHGMPGVISGIGAVIMAAIATKDVYGPSLYLTFPRCAPEEGSDELTAAQAELGSIEAGEGRSQSTQAAFQVAALAITLALAIVSGAVTGLLLNVQSLFDPLHDHQLFDDQHFWSLPADVASGKEEKTFMLDDMAAPTVATISNGVGDDDNAGSGGGSQRGSFSRVAPAATEP